MAEEKEQINSDDTYQTFSYLPEIEAAALRVIVLNNAEAKIDTLPDFVRFRIESAADTLDKCHRRIEALERYVEIMATAEHKAFKELLEEVREDTEELRAESEEND